MLDRTDITTMGARLVAAAMLVATAFAVTVAQADTPNPFTSASIKWLDARGLPATIFVEHDGSTYTHVGSLQTRFRVKAHVKTGYRIYGYVVTVGDVNGLVGLAGSPPEGSWGATGATYDRSVDRSVDFAQPLDAITAMVAVNRCNTAFSELPSVDKPLGGQELIPVFAGFSAGKWQGSGSQQHGYWYPSAASSRPAIAAANVAVQITCRGKPAERSAEIVPKLLNVDIRVEPRGEACPKETKVTAYVDYAEKTTARLRANYNGQTGGFRDVETREVTFAGKTWHRAEFTFIYYLDPGEHKFRIEVESGPNSRWEMVDIDCPTFKVLSVWMKYEVENKPTCPKKVVETVTFKVTRPGTINYEIKHQGGLVMHKDRAEANRQGLGYEAVATRYLTMNAFDAEMMADVKNSSANSGWVRLKVECLEILSGTLDLRDPNADACPRQAEAAFSIRTNTVGPVLYRLDCTGDRSWSGTADAQQTAPNTFIAVGVLPFEVKHDEQISCALKDHVQSPPKIVALRGRHYACIKRGFQPATGGGFVADTRPLSVQPEPPRVVVDPPRPICIGGRIMTTGRAPVRYACRCPVSQSAVATGAHSYRCQGNTTVSVACIGGTVRSGQCICPSNTTRVPTGATAWRCARRPQSKPPSTTVAPPRALQSQTSMRSHRVLRSHSRQVYEARRR